VLWEKHATISFIRSDTYTASFKLNTVWEHRLFS